MLTFEQVRMALNFLVGPPVGSSFSSRFYLACSCFGECSIPPRFISHVRSLRSFAHHLINLSFTPNFEASCVLLFRLGRGRRGNYDVIKRPNLAQFQDVTHELDVGYRNDRLLLEMSRVKIETAHTVCLQALD